MDTLSLNHRLLAALGALVAASILALSLAGRGQPAPQIRAAAQVPVESALEAAILRSMAPDAGFGPGICGGGPSISPTLIRVFPGDLTIGETYLTFQNIGDCDLLVIQHQGAGGSQQLGKVLAGMGGTIVLRLAAGDSIQVLGLANGVETRFAWVGRVRRPEGV